MAASIKEVVGISLVVSLAVTVLTPTILGFLRRECGERRMHGRRGVHYHMRRARGNQNQQPAYSQEVRNMD